MTTRHRLTRREMYERVWTTPMQRLAKEFGMSDVGLAKTCRRYNIPVPPRGYWAKKAAGTRVTQTALPDWKDGSDVIFIDQPEPAPAKAPEQVPKEVAEARDYEGRPGNRIVVPETVARFHSLVRKTRDSLKSGSEDPRGVRHSGQGCLAVSVTRNEVPRALRIMHALVTALEARGATVQVPPDTHDVWQPRERFHVAAKIHGEFIEFGITERLTQARNPDTSSKTLFEYRPAFLFTATGTLSLRSRTITQQHRWADSEKRRLEDMLNDFVLALFEAAISHREYRRRQAEQARRDAAEGLRRYEENRRIKELEDECSAWARSQQLRAYLRAVQRTARKNGPIETGSKLDRWLTWARAHADATDPLRGN